MGFNAVLRDKSAIRILGDPVLRTPCKAVDEFDKRLSKLVDEMFDIMYKARGVGLAANQIGVGLRLFVYDCPDGEGADNKGYLINPELVINEGEDVTEPEGCLSVPGHYFDTVRASSTTLSGVDLHGNQVSVSGKGYFARCLQHELDHLNGTVYIDRLAGDERRRALRAIRAAAPSKPSLGKSSSPFGL
nr:peptide deformylase [Actinoplanes sichuanensis]